MTDYADYDLTLDLGDRCAPHVLPHCRICRALARHEAAIERAEGKKDEHDDE